MRKPFVMLLAAGLMAGSCARAGDGEDPAAAAASAGLPAGYALRLDRQNREPGDFVATGGDDDLRVQTGPAGIAYRPDQAVDAGRYVVTARFTELDAPVGHLEGFGLFIGGVDLEGADQRYIYFLVRGDGRYLIRERDGGSTKDVSSGWQASPSVRAATPEGGDVTNDLAIVVEGGQLCFLCNGQAVAEIPVGELSTYGAVGVRVNHNLRVRIENFRVER